MSEEGTEQKVDEIIDEQVEEVVDEYGDPDDLDEEPTDSAEEEDAGGEVTEEDESGGDEKAASEPEKEEPVFDDQLLEIAASMGISKEKATAFSTPRDLELHLTDLLEKQSAEGSEKKEDDEPKDELDLDPEEWDEDSIKVIKKLEERFDKKNAALQEKLDAATAQLERISEANQNQVMAAFARQFDQWVDELGDTYHDVFGEGPGSNLDPKSSAYENRNEVFREMLVTAEGWSKAHPNKPLPEDHELFKRAVRSQFGDKEQTRVRKELEDRVVKRSKQISARPTQRRTAKDEDPIERAAARIDAFQRANYGSEDDLPEDEYGI